MDRRDFAQQSTRAPARDATRRVAIVCSLWHANLVARARDAFIDEMSRCGWSSDGLLAFDVPGAFEIPLLAQTLARRGEVAAVVACALVVDGGIYRHEFVAQAVVDGLMRVQLDTHGDSMRLVATFWLHHKVQRPRHHA